MNLDTYACPSHYYIVVKRIKISYTSWFTTIYWFLFFPPPDPTLTLPNVITVVGMVKNWKVLGGYLLVPDSKMKTREEMLDYFITTTPGASWETLAGHLYYMQQDKALEKMSDYLKRQPGMGGWSLTAQPASINTITYMHQIFLTLSYIHPMTSYDIVRFSVSLYHFR